MRLACICLAQTWPKANYKGIFGSCRSWWCSSPENMILIMAVQTLSSNFLCGGFSLELV